MIHVLFAGGGTGGHLYPLIAVAEALREQHGKANIALRYIGPKSPMIQNEQEAFHKIDIPTRFVFAGKMRRYYDVKNFIDPFVTIIGIIQSLVYVLRDMPDVVFAKGGYGSVPVVIAAWVYRIPIMVHESDAVPGISNRIIGKLARRIGITYHHAEQYFHAHKVALVGVPIQKTIIQSNKKRAYEHFHITANRPVIFVVGGSQGARAINKAIVSVLEKLHKKAQIIHQTGVNNYDDVIHSAARVGVKSGREGYHPIASLSAQEMGDAYSIADIVISRAGATSIAEIAAHQKAAILIPLNLSANDHQRMNAYEIAKAGGTVVLEESNIGRAMLMENIDKILDDAVLRANLESKIKDFYHPLAAEHIAQGLTEMAK